MWVCVFVSLCCREVPCESRRESGWSCRLSYYLSSPFTDLPCAISPSKKIVGLVILRELGELVCTFNILVILYILCCLPYY